MFVIFKDLGRDRLSFGDKILTTSDFTILEDVMDISNIMLTILRRACVFLCVCFLCVCSFFVFLMTVHVCFTFVGTILDNATHISFLL